MRRLRERKRNGIFLVTLEVGKYAVDELVRRGHLRDHERQDRVRIEAAIAALLSSALRS